MLVVDYMILKFRRGVWTENNNLGSRYELGSPAVLCNAKKKVLESGHLGLKSSPINYRMTLGK